jgi:VanZ family protein
MMCRFQKRAAMMAWLTNRYIRMGRIAAWIGILAIIILSVVPAEDRPVTGAGQWLEHFAAFAMVGCAFAIGYRLSLTRLLFLAVFFCAGIEVLQIPLPTRHARVSDFLIDVVGACFAVVCVFVARQILATAAPSAAQLRK